MPKSFTDVARRAPRCVGGRGGGRGGEVLSVRLFSCYLELSIGASYPAELLLSRMLHQVSEHSRQHFQALIRKMLQMVSWHSTKRQEGAERRSKHTNTPNDDRAPTRIHGVSSALQLTECRIFCGILLVTRTIMSSEVFPPRTVSAKKK